MSADPHQQQQNQQQGGGGQPQYVLCPPGYQPPAGQQVVYLVAGPPPATQQPGQQPPLVAQQMAGGPPAYNPTANPGAFAPPPAGNLQNPPQQQQQMQLAASGSLRRESGPYASTMTQQQSMSNSGSPIVGSFQLGGSPQGSPPGTANTTTTVNGAFGASPASSRPPQYTNTSTNRDSRSNSGILPPGTRPRLNSAQFSNATSSANTIYFTTPQTSSMSGTMSGTYTNLNNTNNSQQNSTTRVLSGPTTTGGVVGGAAVAPAPFKLNADGDFGSGTMGEKNLDRTFGTFNSLEGDQSKEMSDLLTELKHSSSGMTLPSLLNPPPGVMPPNAAVVDADATALAMVEELRREPTDRAVRAKVLKIPPHLCLAMVVVLDKHHSLLWDLCTQERGNVVCHLIEKLGGDQCFSLVRYALDHFSELARNQSGCIALPRILQCVKVTQREVFFEALITSFDDLITHPYGNYVVKYFLTTGESSHIAGIVKRIVSNKVTTPVGRKGGAGEEEGVDAIPLTTTVVVDDVLDDSQHGKVDEPVAGSGEDNNKKAPTGSKEGPREEEESTNLANSPTQDVTTSTATPADDGGRLCYIATNKFGSHILDDLFKACKDLGAVPLVKAMFLQDTCTSPSTTPATTSTTTDASQPPAPGITSGNPDVLKTLCHDSYGNYNIQAAFKYVNAVVTQQDNGELQQACMAKVIPVVGTSRYQQNIMKHGVTGIRRNSNSHSNVASANNSGANTPQTGVVEGPRQGQPGSRGPAGRGGGAGQFNYNRMPGPQTSRGVIGGNRQQQKLVNWQQQSDQQQQQQQQVMAPPPPLPPLSQHPVVITSQGPPQPQQQQLQFLPQQQVPASLHHQSPPPPPAHHPGLFKLTPSDQQSPNLSGSNTPQQVTSPPIHTIPVGQHVDPSGGQQHMTRATFTVFPQRQQQ